METGFMKLGSISDGLYFLAAGTWRCLLRTDAKADEDGEVSGHAHLARSNGEPSIACEPSLPPTKAGASWRCGFSSNDAYLESHEEEIKLTSAHQCHCLSQTPTKTV